MPVSPQRRPPHWCCVAMLEELDLLNHELAGPFWQAAAENRLAICTCTHCVKDIWYPTAECTSCNRETSWRDLGGQARLLSWTVVERALNPHFAVPYIPAIVEPLDAPGVQLVTWISPEFRRELVCDMVLQVVFDVIRTVDGNEYTAPQFAPV